MHSSSEKLTIKEEIVRLCTGDKASSVTRQAKGFHRVLVMRGETKLINNISNI